MSQCANFNYRQRDRHNAIAGISRYVYRNVLVDATCNVLAVRYSKHYLSKRPLDGYRKVFAKVVAMRLLLSLTQYTEVPEPVEKCLLGLLATKQT